MEPENRPDPSRNLPAVPSEPVYRPPGPDPWDTSRQRRLGGGANPSPAAPWLRRLRPRSVRLAVGLGILGAAILLFPFAAAQATGQNYAWWLPIGLGVGSLALITLFRLDRVLFGWAPHVAGIVLVGTLVWQTSANPWAWGLAVGVGVVVAGLFLLPRWRVLAAGAVLLVVFGVGYQFRSAQLEARTDAQMQQTQDESKGRLGASNPRGVLPLLLSNIARNNSDPICDNLLAGSTAAAFAAANQVPDCRAAVAKLHASVTDPARYGSGSATIEERGADVVIDGCSIRWRSVDVPGPQIGYLTAGLTTGTTYVITDFRAC